MISHSFGKRIGLMGGSFDPIHYGHLMLAEQIRTSFFLDEVRFIPVGKPPHKTLSEGANKYQRLEMTRLAVQSNPFFSVSEIEVLKDETTYTIDTIKAIRGSLQAEDKLYFITGADAIMLIETWKDYRELLSLVTFIGATRPGVDESALTEKIKSLSEFDIQLCHIPALAISSSDIRKRVWQNASIKYLLPEVVEYYIHAHFLYGEHHPKFDELYAFLKKSLSEKRFKHILETAHTAKRLALLNGEDPIKAEFAGLCHDIAKEIRYQHMQHLIDTFDVYKDESIVFNPNLAHGEVGAGILVRDFNIQDEAVLEAVRWHTYGHLDMTMLSKIIYLSDIIEPTRDFEGVEQLRLVAYQDINAAILLYHNQCMTHLSDRKLKMHSYTLDMINQLKSQR